MNAAVVADPAAADGEEGAARRISNAPGLRAVPTGAPPTAKVHSALWCSFWIAALRFRHLTLPFGFQPIIVAKFIVEQLLQKR